MQGASKKGGNVTLTELIAQFFSARTDFSKNTTQAYRHDLAAFVAWVTALRGTEVTVISITTDLLNEYLNSLSDQLRVGSIKRQMAALRALFSFGIQECVVTAGFDCSHVRFSGMDKQKELLDPAVLCELCTLPKGDKDRAVRDRAMFALLCTGLIKMEHILALVLSDVQFPECEIHFTHRGKKVVIPMPHGGALNRALFEYVNVARPQTVERCHDRGTKTTNALFLTGHGRRMTRQAFHKNLTRYVKQAGLPPETTPRTVLESAVEGSGATDLARKRAAVDLLDALRAAAESLRG